MKAAQFGLFGLLSALMICVSFGCKTDEPGVKSTYRSQYANVRANTQNATEAAKDVLEELDLRNITSASTGVDGKVSGTTADGTQVNVTVERVNDENSTVTVNVGAMGDPQLGKDILAKIRKELD